MNTNSYLRIENGYDISKITGAIPQNIGEGFQFNLSGKTYTTMGSYTKDKKRLMNIEISSFCGLCGGAIHYYAKLYINVSNVCGNSSVSGYLGGIEIPNEYQTIKGEFVRPLTQKEIDKQPKRWGNWYQVGDLVNAFESLEEIENLIKKLKKKFSSKEWKVEEKVGEELGVSVYEAHKNINGTYSPVLPFPINEKVFNDFIHHVAYFTGNKYLVTGDLLDETGTDGEPLIKNVKILMKL